MSSGKKGNQRQGGETITRASIGRSSRRRVRNPAWDMEIDPAEKRSKVNLNPIIARRDYARGKLVENYRQLDKEKKKDEINLANLKMWREKLTRSRQDLEGFDAVIQSELQGDDLIQDVHESGDILDHLADTASELDSLIRDSGRIEDGLDNGPRLNSGVNHRATSRLPKLEIKQYDGNLIRYQEFWEQFENSIDQREDLPDTEKFTYLRSLLIGMAADTIDGLSLTSANYRVALGLLKEKFGNEQAIINAHFQNILELSITSTKTSALSFFHDKMEMHIRCLEALGLKEEEFAKALVPMILRKLPPEIKLQLNRLNGSAPWQLTALRHCLKAEVMARENAGFEKSDSGSDIDEIDDEIDDKPERMGVRKDSRHTKITKCHWDANSTGSGRDRSIEVKNCFTCGETGHIAMKCSTIICRHCGEKGHTQRYCGTIKCFQCGEMGHISIDCPENRKKPQESEANGGDSE